MIALLLALAALALAPSPAEAQSVRYRRPYEAGYRLNYGFDHNGGGGCTDYACGGACYDGHTGSDFGTPFGTPILAAASGTVIARNDGCANYGAVGNTCGGRCGNYVQLRHSDGSTSIYCHMRAGSLRVGVGASVGCGQHIGDSASSGSSSGPHLHFGHRSPGASSSDPFAGGCSRATTLWTSQPGYRDAPGTGCHDVCSPSGESCNGRDDDCDGRTDEGLSRGCGTDVGECVSGVQACGGGSWGGCAGEVAPRGETCDSRDEDCDGRTDESLARSCGTDVGECVAGTETCEGGAWSACRGAIDPVPEVCDRLDNDCDGSDDDERICEREEIAHSAPLFAASSSSDVDGDGRADGCAVRDARFACLASSAHGFARELPGPTLDLRDLFRAATLRTGDLDGDGRADVCAREGDRLACWRADGTGFPEALLGPAYDASTTSLDLADVDGDGRLDACARDASGLRCHLGTDHGFGDRVIRLDALSDAAGFADPVHHGSIRLGDLDGDGRADVCARGADGVDCWASDGDRFERIAGPRWSDADGWDLLPRWSTIRLADVDGDGGDDLCARTPDGLRCVVTRGRRFDRTLAGPATPAERGWDRVEVYATLRAGDVDGDGRSDLCAREPDGVRCWLSDGRSFDRVVLGPPLSDASGWAAPERFRSIRLADVDADGRADLCARGEAGLLCSLSTGTGFDRTWLAPAWRDASLGSAPGGATIRIAGGAASPTSRALAGTISCAASTSSGRPSAAVLVLGTALVLAARRRRPRQECSLA